MSTERYISEGIRGKLSSLRRLIRAHLVGRGLAWMLTALVLSVFLSLAIDYSLHMERLQRLLILAIVAGGVGYVAWRFLLRPLSVPMGPEEMALVLERHYGQLDDRLISALQFGRLDAQRTGTSEALMGQVARQADEYARRLNVTGPVESGRTLRRLGMGTSALVVLLVFTAFYTPTMAMWFQRNVLFQNVEWPKKTRIFFDDSSFRVHRGDSVDVLKFEDFRSLRIGRGDTLEVVVHADPNMIVPEEVVCHSSMLGQGRFSQVITPDADDKAYHITFPNAGPDIEFYVTGNDDRTETVRVQVVPPPELTSIELAVKPPDYTDEGVVNLNASAGVMTVQAGSTLIVRSAMANKDLASARLVLDGKVVSDLAIESVKDNDGKDRPWKMTGKFSLPDRVEKTSMSMEFQLADREGFVSKPGSALYTLRVDPDRAPTLGLGRTGVRGDITGKCIIPLLLEIHDDHGIASGFVTVTITTPEKTDTTSASASQPTTTSAPAFAKIDLKDIPMKKKDVKLSPRLMLTKMAWFSTDPELQKIMDHELVPGQIVTIQATVQDNLPASFGGPNVTQSAPISFKVISEEDLMTELIRRQTELAGDLFACITIEAAVRDRLKGVDLGAPEAPATLSGCVEDHGRVIQQTNIVVQQLSTVMEEMESNQAGQADERADLSRAIDSLKNLTEKNMVEAAGLMDRASKSRKADAVAEAGLAAEKLVADMMAIHEKLKQALTVQNAINAVKVLQGLSEVQKNAIMDQIRKDLGTVLAPTSGPVR